MTQFQRKATLRGLVMTRKQGEKIRINHGELLIEVIEIRGRQVRLAFQASKEIVIQRFEGSKDTVIHEEDSAIEGPSRPSGR